MRWLAACEMGTVLMMPSAQFLLGHWQLQRTCRSYDTLMHGAFTNSHAVSEKAASGCSRLDDHDLIRSGHAASSSGEQGPLTSL